LCVVETLVRGWEAGPTLEGAGCVETTVVEVDSAGVGFGFNLDEAGCVSEDGVDSTGVGLEEEGCVLGDEADSTGLSLREAGCLGATAVDADVAGLGLGLDEVDRVLEDGAGSAGLSLAVTACAFEMVASIPSCAECEKLKTSLNRT
jgi:hypothetical protein